MILGNVGKELGENRTEHACEDIHHTRFLTYFHDSQPQGKHAGESQGSLKGSLGSIKRGVHDLLKDGGIAHAELYKAKDKGNEKKCNPNVI